MNFLLKIVSYLFHPLLMPLLATLFYFFYSPRFTPVPVRNAKILAISILTIFIPVVFYFLLKNLKIINSHELTTVAERKIPLLFLSIILLIINYFVMKDLTSSELYFYFRSYIYAVLIALFLIYFKVKVSLHMMAFTALTSFVILMSYLYEINLVYLIAILFFVMGLIASSRLHLQSHNLREILLGIVVGFLPQVRIFLYT
ncbi:hypothetical protein [Mesonia sp. K7]|uniref:hypothetical protein n=1 Tax=Mesonia sp. K7 TaxID=2218606 RepID=UPI000DA743B8|nr:hypothetical protein [Mesonia sp. K7]PZD78416.1 hypothetical protein DNG35_04960 [Mesonia sp. K7]